MPLDASTVAILVSAAVALLAALSTGVVQVIVALRTERKVDANTDITRQTVKVTSGAAADTAVILGHVNSEATRLKAEVSSLREQIESQRLQLEAAERRALALAQAEASQEQDVTPGRGRT